MRMALAVALAGLFMGACSSSGDQGPAGVAGPSGPAGLQGPQGPTGPGGAAGTAGPAGPSGPTGPQGAQGPSLAFTPWLDGNSEQRILDLVDANTTTLASVNLPPGAYVVLARVSLNNLSGAESGATCMIVQGAANVLDAALTDLLGAGVGSRDKASLQASTVVPAGGATIALTCQTGAPPVRTFFPHLAAIQVGALVGP